MKIIIYSVLFFGSIFLGVLLEYILHRWIIHSRFKLFSHIHNIHHKRNQADSVFTNYLTYIWITLPVIWVGFYYDWIGGICFVIGTMIYVYLLSLIHHKAHMAVTEFDKIMYHYHWIHHQNNKKNFGVTTSFWDKVFGTYSEGL